MQTGKKRNKQLETEKQNNPDLIGWVGLVWMGRHPSLDANMVSKMIGLYMSDA